MKNSTVAAWLASCILVPYLIGAVTPNAGILGHMLSSVATGLLGFIALARHENMVRAQIPPAQHHYHHYEYECCNGPGDDDGYDGWLDGPDRPRFPYPPSRN